MKNKFTILLTCIMAVCLSAFTFTACDVFNDNNQEPHEHTFSNYVSNDDATCETNATETAKCNGCNETDTREIANSKLGHSFTVYISNNNATSSADGTKTAVCNRPGCNVTDTVTDEGTKLLFTDASAFIFDNGTITGLTEYGKSLTSIIIPDSINGVPVTKLATGSIGGIKKGEENTILKSLYLPSTLIEYEDFAIGACLVLEEIIVHPDNQKFRGVNGNLYSGDGKRMLQYASGKNEQVFMVPNGVEIIDSKAFQFGGEEESATTLSINNIAGSFANNQITRSFTKNFLVKTTTLSYVSKLTSVILPDSVTSIGEGAFAGCTSLQSIVISDSVTSIGHGAFYECRSLSRVDYLGTIDDWAQIEFYAEWEAGGTTPLYYGAELYINNVLVTNVDINNATHISARAFYKYKSLKNVIIGNSVESIGNSAFYDCESLASVIIGDNVKSIGHWAFRDCRSLASITIGNGVENIGIGAFVNCDSLKSVIIPNSVTNISDYAFEYCGLLRSVTIGNSVESIGDKAFYYCALISVTIGNSVENIGAEAFMGCDELVEIVNKSTHITVNKGSTDNGYIGYYAHLVSNCDDSYESKITIDSNGCVIYNDDSDKILVGYVGSQTDLTLPNDITSIDFMAFYNCTWLTSVVIPDSVTSIGYDAFYNCTSLTSVNYLGTTDEWAQIEFNNSSSNPIAYAKNLYINGDLVTEAVLNVSEIKDYAFFGCTSLTEITFGDSVTSIGYRAFSYCDSLTSVVIGDSVTSIGDYAFYNCSSLTSIVIPNSVTSIGYEAFYNCTSLTSVNYLGTTDEWAQIEFNSYSSNPLEHAKNLYINGDLVTEAVLNVSEIKDYAFFGCTSLTEITFGNSVEKIGNYAFRGCTSLTEITFGNSVTSIGDYAFSGCNSLTKVYYNGSINEWQKVNKSSLSLIGTCDLVDCIDGKSCIRVHLFTTYVTDSNSSSNTKTKTAKCDREGCTVTDTILDDATIFEPTDASAFIFDSGTITGLTDYGKTLKEIIVPQVINGIEVLSIGDCAFSHHTNIETLVLCEGLQSLGNFAFNNCSSLKNLVIPEVAFVGDDIFGGLKSIETLTISSTKIFEYNQYGLENLKELIITNACYVNIDLVSFESLETLNIGGKTTEIGEECFYGWSSVTKIIIGKSVQKIGDYAFYDLYTLNEINYEGTMAEWDAVIKGDYWVSSTATKVICSDGEVTL